MPIFALIVLDRPVLRPIMHNSSKTTSIATPDRSQEINPPPRVRRRIVPVQARPDQPAPDRRRRKSTFKKADVARAISAVTKGGLVPASVEIGPDGNIRIYTVGAEPVETLFDQWANRL